MLLTLEQIRQRLDQEFLQLEPIVTGMRLVQSTITETQIESCENHMRTVFPEAFRRILVSYDLGRLTIGPIAFCNSGDYASYLLRINCASEFGWWGEGDRPEGWLMVANSDPYAVLLNTNNGEVFVLRHGEEWKERKCAAFDFETFLQAIGTVFVERLQETEKEAFARRVAATVGGQDAVEFWNALAA